MKSHTRARLTHRGPLASTSSFHVPDVCWNSNSERCSPCRTVFIPIPLTLTPKPHENSFVQQSSDYNANSRRRGGSTTRGAQPESLSNGRISGPGLAPGSCDSSGARRSAHPAGRATPLREPQPRLLLPSAGGSRSLRALRGHRSPAAK